MHKAPPEPMYNFNEGPVLILDLPQLPDETALQLSELLQLIAERFTDSHSQQICRAHRAREQQAEVLYQQSVFAHSQHPLPLEDPEAGPNDF